MHYNKFDFHHSVSLGYWAVWDRSPSRRAGKTIRTTASLYAKFLNTPLLPTYYTALCKFRVKVF